MGFETYQKILAEAVKELKNEEFADILHDEEADKEYYADEIKGADQIQDDEEEEEERRPSPIECDDED